MSSNARSRMGAYGRIPKQLLRDPNLSARAKVTVAMIDEIAGHETITIERLAEWLGCTPDTARRAVHEARDAGWVEIRERRHAGRQIASEYIANGEPGQADDAPEESGERPSENREGAVVDSATPGTPENQGSNNETDETIPSRGSAQPRATRLEEGWQPDEELLVWARTSAPGLDLELETEKFRDYWLSKGGKDATKLDWRRTWRNWIRTAYERLPAFKRSGAVSPEQSKAEAVASDARREDQRRWLEARGSSLEEYQQRKDEPGWFDALRARKVSA